MKDERINELVNLYLDSECSDTERSELEQVLAFSSDRQREFLRLVRMQAAVGQILRDHPEMADFEAGEESEDVADESKVVWFRHWMAPVTGLAAACFLVVFYIGGPLSKNGGGGGTPIAEEGTDVPMQPAATVAAIPTVAEPGASLVSEMPESFQTVAETFSASGIPEAPSREAILPNPLYPWRAVSLPLPETERATGIVPTRLFTEEITLPTGSELLPNYSPAKPIAAEALTFPARNLELDPVEELRP